MGALLAFQFVRLERLVWKWIKKVLIILVLIIINVYTVYRVFVFALLK